MSKYRDLCFDLLSVKQLHSAIEHDVLNETNSIGEVDTVSDTSLLAVALL